MLEERDALQVEELVRRHIRTCSRDFGALRASGVVDLDLLSRGALEHGDSRVRRSCLILLDHLGDERQVPVFAAALRNDPVPRNRRHALHALTCDKCKTTQVCVDVSDDVRAASRDPNPKVRALASSLMR